MNTENTDRQRVILLHGILRSPSHMRRMEKALVKKGYDVLNIGYPSSKHSIEELLEIIKDKIPASDKTTHLVGFSMGGVLVLELALSGFIKNLGHVIQLAPPNGGSELVDKIGHWRLYQKLFGPAGAQLSVKHRGTLERPQAYDFPLHIAAGSAAWEPISWLIMPKPNDGKVTVESTKIPGHHTHRVFKTSHTYFPLSRSVIKYVIETLAA